MNSPNLVISIENLVTATRRLSTVQMGELLQGLIGFAVNGDEDSTQDPMAGIALDVLINDIKRADAKYEERTSRNRANGTKRWHANDDDGSSSDAKSCEPTQSHAVASSGIPDDAKLCQPSQSHAVASSGTVTKQNKTKQNQTNIKRESEREKSEPVPDPVPVPSEPTPPKPKRERFVPPSPSDVLAYCKEKGIPFQPVDAQRFVDFYASKGWMVGSNHMSDWKAAVRNWANRAFSPGSPVNIQQARPVKTVVEQQYDQRQNSEHSATDRPAFLDKYKDLLPPN